MRSGRQRLLGPRARAQPIRRGAALASVVAVAMLGITPPTGTAAGPASISLSRVWSWLTATPPPPPPLPIQETGTARGKPHLVPAAGTRAGRGNGRRPGKGAGQLPPYVLHTPGGKTSSTGPGFGDGSHSFNARTSKLVPSRSTATSTLYRNADGTYTRHVYEAPVNYPGPGGTWLPIQTALRPGTDGRFHEAANSLAVDLAATANRPDLASVSFGAGGAGLSYGLQGAAAAPAQVSGATATYAAVLPGTDLRLTAVGSGLQESLVLHSAAAPSSWVFPLRLRGLTPRQAGDGSVDFLNAAGQVVARVPHGYMRDSSTNRRSGGPAESAAVTYQLVTSGGSPALRMSVDAAWLRAPGRVFPVTVDPDITASGTATTNSKRSPTGSTYVETQYDNNDYSSYPNMLIGTFDAGTHKANSFLAFSGLGSSLSGQRITSASLSLFDFWAATCTAEPLQVSPITQSWSVTGNKSWPGPSFGSSIGSVTANPGAACTNTAGDLTTGTWMTVGLSTGTFNSWTTGGADNGLAVWASNTDSTQWKQLDSFSGPNGPYLTLNYTPDVPPQIDSQYPPDNYGSPTLTPELIASGHDPDNWPNSAVSYNFTVYSSSGAVVANSGNISSSDWVVPAGKLSWSQPYYWSVQDYDGFDYSAAVTTNYFSTVVPQPLITSSLGQNTGGHGFDPSIGNYTTSTTDANVQTAGPALSVGRDYNSLDPRVSGAFGAGWSSVQDMKATEVDDAGGNVTSVVITYPDGQQVGFGKNGNGTFAPPQGRFATLTALAGHTGYTLTDKNDTVYTFGQATQASHIFAISSIADYLHRSETFSYSGGQLTTATAGVSGRALHFTWGTPSGAQDAHVTSVATDPVTPGTASTALTWTYSYSGDQLTAVCPPASPSSCTTYAYTTGSDFPTAVLDAGPHSYWRMTEASGTTAASAVTANEGNDNGTYSNVTLGQPGPLPGSGATSASFNGTSSYLNLPNDLVFQSTYATVSMWFKTTSGSAGMLFSTGHSAPGTSSPSSRAMPVLYVGSDGKLYGHFWNSTVPGMSSSGKINDGKWHFVVLTSAENTQTLYLDGAQVGTLGGQIANVDPVDMIGTGVFNSDGWPAAPSGNTWNYFNGQIADAAYYTHYLTGPAAQFLYTTGHGAASLLNKVTTPAGNVMAQVSYDTTTDRVTSVTDENGGTWSVGAPKVTGSSQVFRSAVMGAAPAGYWRLGDSGSATQAGDEVRGGYGQYSNVTLGTGGPFQDETAASFNGTSSSVSLPDNLVNGATTLSVGLWFKTTSASTGTLFSTGHSPPGTSGPSGQAMPALYVGSDGKLYGHFWNSNVAGMSSPGKVNDGKWHFVVLTGAGSAQALYLDGRQIGTQSGQIAGVDPLDMLGAGVYNNDGWPAAPSGNNWNYFNGSIGEAAFYRSQLTAAQVTTQWSAYRSSSGAAPAETVGVTDPGGKTLSYTYDPLSGDRMLSQADALGSKTSYGYDTSGFQYTVTNPDGAVTTTGHDVRGNVVSQTTCQDQAANKCSTEYYTYYPNDTSTNLSPDPRNDLVLTMRDGRSASATDPQYVTSYAYDSAGNHVSITTPTVAGFPGGRTTAMTYTTTTTPAAGGGSAPAGLLASAASPGGGIETITYYANGDPAAVTDPAGEKTTYSYDGLGRAAAKTVLSNSYPGGLTTAYTYDGRGDVLTQTDPGVTDHITGAVHTAQTTNSYDVDGNLTAVTVADLTGGDTARTTKHSYNPAGQLASTTDPKGAVTSYAYDGYGNKIKQVDPAGNETDYTFDPNGHLLTTALAGYTGDPANPSGPATLVEESRAYDPAGHLASITDSMGRVTAYTYTDNGLLASIARQYPATGQSFAQQSNSYDAAGNLIQRVANNGTTTTNYTVDAADRNILATLDPSGLNRTTTYTYSPDDYVLNVTHTDGSGNTTSTDASYDPLGRMTSQITHDDSAGHPAGWWQLTASSGTPTYAADTSGSGQTGIVSGGVSLSSGGGTFNGSSGGVSLPGGLIASKTELSISLWFETTSASTGTLFSTGDSAPGTSSPTGKAMPVLYVGSDGKLHGHFWTTGGNVPGITSSGVVNDGKWHHVVLSGSGASQALYLDGTQAGTLSGQINNADPLNMVGAGVYNNDGWPAAPSGNTWNYFHGQIADVQLYDRALSAVDAGTLDADGRSGGALGAKPLTTSWTLDQRGLPTSMTNPDGNTTSYLYDEAGKLASSIQPAVNTETGGGAPVAAHPVTSYGYDTFGDRVAAQDPNGNVTTVGYDANGRQVSQTLPSYTPPGSSTPITATSTRTYTSLGQVLATTDALGNATSYAYDQLGDVATVTDPAGGVTKYGYDTAGDRLAQTDPAGAQTEATYDYLGRQLTATQIVRQPATAADTTTSAYSDAAGLLSSTITPTGVTTSYAYDAAGERTRVTDGAGNTTGYGYDMLGRAISTVAPDGTSKQVAYDEAGNPVATMSKDAAGNALRSMSAGYDAAGQRTSATDAMGNTSTFSYDATGLLTQQVQPVSAGTSITTSFGYDAAGNRTRYTDANGNTTNYTYNNWNLPESTIVPATTAYPGLADRTLTTAYNADGQVSQRTAPGGVTVSDTYDALGRLTSQAGAGAEAPTATRSFGYNAVGDLTSASTQAGSDTFSYDDRGLLLSASGSSGASSFSYTHDGQMASRTDASGTATYSYDNAGRLATLADAATGTQLTYGYNTVSLLSSIQYGTGGATRTFTYNGLHERTGDTLASTAGQTEASISYGYNANGDETSKTTSGFAGSGGNTYTYDAADRLTSWNNGATTVSYGYDANGNRTQVGAKAYTYDARDELTSGNGTSYAYTARGTPASATSSQGTTSTTSDAFNQVSADGSQSYSYDALGRMLTSPGHAFAYSGTANDAATDGTNHYSRAPSGNLVGVAQGSNAVLALTDQHNDVVGEFTATGSALTGSTAYDPLGNVTAASNQVGSLGYQSGWTDPSTGKVNMATRWYNPATGQFTSRDSVANSPVPDPAAANTFAYGQDNPLTAFDPTGTCDWWNPLCGAAQVASNVGSAVSSAWNNVSSAASSAWNDFTGAVSSAWNAASQAAQHVYQAAAQAVTNFVGAASHAVSSAATWVSDGWQNTWQPAINYVWHATTQTVGSTWRAVAHAVYTGAGTVWQTTQHVVYATFHAVKYGVQSAAQFVQHHAATIVSFVASTAVFVGCEAAVTAVSAGTLSIPGAIGCGALSGAVGGAIDYAMSTPMSKWSAGGFALQVGIGALAGGAGGLLGAFGGKLLGPVFKSVAGRLGIAALDDGASAGGNALSDAARGAADNAGGAADNAGGAAADNATSGAADPSAASGAPSTTAADAPAPSEQPAAAACGGMSFAAATAVLLVGGGKEAISKLRVGQKVLATNTKTGKNQGEAVAAVLVNHDTDLYDLTVESGGHAAVIHTTSNHLFWDPYQHQWIASNKLSRGERLKTPDGATVTVVGGTTPKQHDGWMWDLTVPGNNDHDFYVLASTGQLGRGDRDTYYAGAGDTPVLVHNSGPCGIGNALRNWSSQRFQFGNQQFLLDKGNMTHILERHMPEYWDGSVKASQSFFDKSMSIQDVQDAIGGVLGQNRDTLISRGPTGIYQIQGSYGGTDYVLGLNNGHIGQFYPGTLP